MKVHVIRVFSLDGKDNVFDFCFDVEKYSSTQAKEKFKEMHDRYRKSDGYPYTSFEFQGVRYRNLVDMKIWDYEEICDPSFDPPGLRRKIVLVQKL